MMINMRKMAVIAVIDEIKPIPDANKICAYRVGGWWVVDTVGKYNVGDYVVYCEVDSWIPNTIAPFLSKGQEPREYNGVKGERLRTVRLRGQISQGLLLPVSVLNQDGVDGKEYPFIEGSDVAELLGIQKWEPPIPAQLAGLIEGPWPSQIQKTDQERIQNLTKEWDVLRDHRYECTEKLEGSSMSVGLINGKFVVCSRNLNLRETQDNSLWAQARRYKIEEKLHELNMDNIVIQGEIIGDGIQGNHYNIKGQDFYVFDVLNIQTGEYLQPATRRELVAKLDLKHVPVLEEGMIFSPIETVEDVLLFADGNSKLNPSKLREGLVFKRVDGSEHWKAVSNKYLIKTGG